MRINYIHIIISLIFIGLPFSCMIDDSTDIDTGEDGMIVLRFNLPESKESVTKTIDGEDELNENLIKTLHIYIYKVGADNCSYNEYLVAREIVEGTDENTVHLKAKKDVFTAGEEYITYVIANLTEHALTGITGMPNLSELQKRITKAINPVVKQSSFLMDGMSSPLILNDGGNSRKTISIDLKRAAAKIRVGITYKNGITPAPNAVLQKRLMNYTTSSRVLSSGVLPADPGFVTSGEETEFETITIENCTYPGFVLYCYEHDWNNSDDRETFIVINIPLTGKPENYYKVPVRPVKSSTSTNLKNIERNYMYDISVNIDTEGSGSSENPVEVEGNLKIMEWTVENFSAVFPSSHWLYVKQNSIRIVNTDEYALEYSSDLPVEIKNVTAKYLAISFEGKESEAEYTEGIDLYYPDGRFPKIEADMENFIIYIRSLIPNNYVPLTINFDVTNNNGLTEHIQVIQYPSQYITAEQSQGDVVPVWLPENHLSDQVNYNFFTITTLYSDRFIIGDPTFGTGDTDHTERVDKIISPRFIVASQHGIYNGGTDWEDARKRCKDYGEDKYRTGWRMPTLAEITTINAIQADENSAIKKLFYGRAYWFAKTNWAYKMSKWERTYRPSETEAYTQWENQVPGPFESPDGEAIIGLDGIPDIVYLYDPEREVKVSSAGGIRCVHDDY